MVKIGIFLFWVVLFYVEKVGKENRGELIVYCVFSFMVSGVFIEVGLFFFVKVSRS